MNDDEILVLANELFCRPQVFNFTSLVQDEWRYFL